MSNIARDLVASETSYSKDDGFSLIIDNYTSNLSKVTKEFDWTPVHTMASQMLDCWKNNRTVFICGNGGSGANAIHMANDWTYGIAKTFGKGLRCYALPANQAVVTCLANDIGYENIFAHQLSVMAKPGDMLITLSGSGNSANIINVLEMAKKIGVTSYGILGYSGGKAKSIVDTPIHFAIDDMEMSEDLQMIVAHMTSRWLYSQRQSVIGTDKV